MKLSPESSWTNNQSSFHIFSIELSVHKDAEEALHLHSYLQGYFSYLMSNGFSLVCGGNFPPGPKCCPAVDTHLFFDGAQQLLTGVRLWNTTQIISWLHGWKWATWKTVKLSSCLGCFARFIIIFVRVCVFIPLPLAHLPWLLPWVLSPVRSRLPPLSSAQLPHRPEHRDSTFLHLLKTHDCLKAPPQQLNSPKPRRTYGAYAAAKPWKFSVMLLVNPPKNEQSDTIATNG